MKREIIICSILLLIFQFTVFSQSEVIFEISECKDYSKILERNNVFFKWCIDFDVEDNTYIYFLDSSFGYILKVDYQSGKLIKSISSKGQGPGELAWPSSIRVMNSKIYVFDRGFNGVKIFSTEGKFLNSFKITNSGGSGTIDVNKNNEIFLQSTDINKKTILAVYDENGKILRNLIKFAATDFKERSSFLTTFVKIKLDISGNIYVLFPLKRRIEKFSKDGSELWGKEIKSKYFKKTSDEKFEVKDQGVHFSQSIFDLELLPGGNILIGHVSGGTVFNKDGKHIYTISTDPPKNFPLVKIIKDKLMVISLYGKLIRIFDFSKGGIL